MTNVLGNALATSAVSKWEGQLDNHGGEVENKMDKKVFHFIFSTKLNFQKIF